MAVVKFGGICVPQDSLAEPIKILVVGDYKCGKSTFIRAFAENNCAGATSYDHGVTIYPYLSSYRGEPKQFKLIEISGLHNVQNALERHGGGAKGCFFMYAVDDPGSFLHLEEWNLNIGSFINLSTNTRSAVGFKKDLRDDPEVIQRLAEEDRKPVTEQEGRELTGLLGMHNFYDCSMHDSEIITNAFHCMFRNTLLPLEN